MTELRPQNPELAPLIRDRYSAADLAAVRGLLDRHGTLTLTPLASGLFSAAQTTDYSKGTNYHAAWVRDNVHVAYAHFANGRAETAVNAARALTRFFRTQRPRFREIIDAPALKSEARRRPHVRFDGDTLAEIGQSWSHAQNDALGYFVWLSAVLARARVFPPGDWDIDTLALFPRYFRAIEYWADEDSGHWEEAPKVGASSIGAVVAGLRELRALVREAADLTGEGGLYILTTPIRSRIRSEIPEAALDELIGRGEEALATILPAECVQPDPAKERPYDAALLFLIYPLGVVAAATADEIVGRTETHLRGPLGIRRYLGDSFYCTDYETLMARLNDDPTRDFSRDIAARDALLQSGGEAQWCLFDPILSVIFGRRYRQTRNPEDLRKQVSYLNRSLAQVTRDDPPRCRAFQCPELYYPEQGKLQTSKSTPLLWTQANLWTAMEEMRRSVEPGPTGSDRQE
jgi:phosphorylase kinase alpha/beta subunit